MTPAMQHTFHSLPGPEDITRHTFSNGITLLTRANFNSPSVVISGYLPAGGLNDPEEKLGLAQFTAVALMRGTERREFQKIYQTVEDIGASLGLGAGTHTAGFSGRALSEDLDLLLDLLSEVLLLPAFPAGQVERLRAQLLTNLALRAQNTGEMASMAFDELVYAGHPYSRPEDGYPETVKRITRDDLVACHEAYYGPQGMVIAIVGAVEPQAAVEKVQRALGGWVNPDQKLPPDLPPVTSLAEVARKRVDIPGKSQADIILGVAGPPRRSPDYLPASVGNNILGQFGMYGRIGEVVREKAGLAYYAYSSLGSGMGPGPWYVSSGVDPANVEQAIDLIRAEIARYIREPVTPEELADTQANFIGRLPLALESNSDVAGALINLERYELGLDYYQRYPDLVRAVTPEEILAVSRRYLDPERLGIGVAGP